MTGLVKAADVGVFTPTVSADQWAQARDDHGVSLAIVGVWSGREHHSNPAPASLINARKAGLDVAIYAVTNARPAAWTVNHAISLAEDSGLSQGHINLRFFCLDVEVVGAPLTKQQFDDACGAIADAGLRPLIYSGKWYWDGGGDRHMNNPTWAAEAGVPLWASVYDGRHDLNFEDKFGGWGQTHREAIHESKGERQLGFLADLSAFDADWISA